MGYNRILYVKKLIICLLIILFILLSGCTKPQTDEYSDFKNKSITNLIYETNYNSSKKADYTISFDKVDGAEGYIVKVEDSEIDTTKTTVSITNIVKVGKTVTIIVKAYITNKEGIKVYSKLSYITEKINKITTSMKFNPLSDGTYEVSCVSCSKNEITGTVVFPDYYNGKKVTKLATNCLYREMDNFALYGVDEYGHPYGSPGDPINCSTTNVVLPKYITSFGESAFDGCVVLQQFEIPETIKEMGDDCFRKCRLFKSFNIPDGIKYIDCFRECTGITEINLPASVKSIGFFAFYGCTNLEKITMENVENVYEYSFENTKFIEQFDDDFVVVKNFLYKYQGTSKRIDFDDYPKNLKGIKTDIFENNESLEYVAIPYIYSSNYDDKFNINFKNNKTIKTIVIGEGYKSLSQSVIRDMSNLESIVIPTSMNTIRANFKNLESFKTIYYLGTEEQWDKIVLTEQLNENIVIFYYSEEEPIDKGIYWHYVDGEITVW